MDFQNILQLAAKNQKVAEKKLTVTKRYTTKVPPAKKEPRPQVDPNAIRARVEQKEREKQQREVEEERKRKEALKRLEEAERQKKIRSTSKSAKSPAQRSKAAEQRPKEKTEPKETSESKDGRGRYKDRDHEKVHKAFMHKVEKQAEKVRNKERREEERKPAKPKPGKKAAPAPKKPMSYEELLKFAEQQKKGIVPKMDDRKSAAEKEEEEEESDEDDYDEDDDYDDHRKSKDRMHNDRIHAGKNHARLKDNRHGRPEIKNDIKDRTQVAKHSVPKSHTQERGHNKPVSSPHPKDYRNVRPDDRRKVQEGHSVQRSSKGKSPSPQVTKDKSSMKQGEKSRMPNGSAGKVSDQRAEMKKGSMPRTSAHGSDGKLKSGGFFPENGRMVASSSGRTQGQPTHRPDKPSVKQPARSGDRPVIRPGDRSQSKPMDKSQNRPMNRPAARPVSGPSERPRPRPQDHDRERARSSQMGPPQSAHIVRKRPAPRPPNMKLKRGRLLSSDSEESDYDDGDGFIDDSPMDEMECSNVSSYIKEIFGYDKSKYGYESEYALRNMDASYRDVQKEEARSTRLGMLEDLEDIRREKEELKRKSMKKKKR
ncbi:uncharacterized protein [Diadema antillarum]|uniref:uncharacterized protein n=1 Tax=Diadema antillarum TaxID=105358 RepID=UPI003A883D83